MIDMSTDRSSVLLDTQVVLSCYKISSWLTGLKPTKWEHKV